MPPTTEWAKKMSADREAYYSRGRNELAQRRSDFYRDLPANRMRLQRHRQFGHMQTHWKGYDPYERAAYEGLRAYERDIANAYARYTGEPVRKSYQMGHSNAFDRFMGFKSQIRQQVEQPQRVTQNTRNFGEEPGFSYNPAIGGYQITGIEGQRHVRLPDTQFEFRGEEKQGFSPQQEKSLMYRAERLRQERLEMERGRAQMAEYNEQPLYSGLDTSSRPSLAQTYGLEDEDLLNYYYDLEEQALGYY
jgi:hypothetical protein